VNRSDELVRVARHHREARSLCGHLPEAADSEDRLVKNVKPHLALKRLLAIAKVVLVGRILAEGGKRDETTLRRIGRKRTPLRQLQIADVGHVPLRRTAEHIPVHQIDDRLLARFADRVRLAVRKQLLRIAVRPRDVVRPTGAKPLDQRLRSPRKRARLHIQAPALNLGKDPGTFVIRCGI